MSNRMHQFKILKSACILVVLFLLVILSGCGIVTTTDSANDSVSETSSAVESFPELDKNTLENWGNFETVTSLYKQANRNLENPNYVLVTLEKVVVLRGGDSSNRNSMTDNITVVNKESLLESNRVTESGEVKQFRDDEKIRVIMKDDTTNRALHGDIITVTGILDTKNLMIFDAEYEMIEPNE